ncbi:YidE/YbjL duplication [Bacillus sp. FJAT-27225]|uniref:aspartate:alanine exchanger family transporter n=1 Tax=Bacillus sp. FJAT-27225 TaxID=1743144 RepID=UPI00080C34E8|nr:TrkA C-terminal domain-containing protein [Bacillus sp. FJAT-27225]OCA85752.1 YidE/YbjL duplication [Bacillus sp. FJAT-27225]
MGFIRSLLDEPLILLFFILFLGSALGKVSVKGLSLRTSGVLFIAMIFGHYGYQIPDTIQQLGLSLFIVAVGLQAGPRFFRMMKTSGIVFGIIGLVIVLTGALVTILVTNLFNLSPALGIGIMTGALSSTPGLAAALQATNDPITSVGYGLAYPFGVLGVVLFVQLLPRLLKTDLKKDLEATSGPIRNEESPEVLTIGITNPALNKMTLKELHFNKQFNQYNSVVISRVIRGDRNIIALGDTVILKGDHLVAVGLKNDVQKLCKQIGKKVESHFENYDHIVHRKITVGAEEMIGKTLKELGLRRKYGVTVTRIERGGFEYNQSPRWRLERGDVLLTVSSEDRLNDVEKLFSRKNLTVTNVHILSLSLILLIGILVGRAPIYLPGLGTITLGVAGGPLFIALIIGHFGKIGPIRARYFQPSNQVIGDIGLVLFLAGAGTTAGQGVVEVVSEEGVGLLFGGAMITVIPMIVGYYVSRLFFKLSIIHSLGAVCGEMTSTPGLGAASQLIDNDDPAIAYAAAYPFALIFVAIISQVLIFFL